MSETPQADAIVLFGGTGDLARRMLLASLYFLDADGFLPEGFRILATARSDMTREAFLELTHKTLSDRPEGINAEVWPRFAARINYVGADATTVEGATRLKLALEGAKRPFFYLAISPSLYERVCAALAAAGLATDETRIVLEKPIGRDLETSRHINTALGAIFDETQIFRIDHYRSEEHTSELQSQ